jgi:hypothetical protein
MSMVGCWDRADFEAAAAEGFLRRLVDDCFARGAEILDVCSRG